MKLLDRFRKQPEMTTEHVAAFRRDFWMQWGSLFGTTGTAGTTVSEQAAWRLAPVSQAIQMIAEEIATLPLEVWRIGDDNREKATTHPAYRLLRWEAADIFTAAQWRRITMAHTLLYGNGISEIVRDASNRPTAIWPLEPWRVQLYWWEVTGSERRITYRYTSVDGGQRTIQPEDVIHIRAMDNQAGLWGDSPVLRCAGAIGLTQAAQDFAAAFFANGSSLAGVLEHPGSLGEEAFKSLKQSWAEAHQGGPNKAYKPAILEEGMSWKPIGTPPEEGQMIETRDQQVKEIARVFNIPPHRLGASSDSFTYSNEVMERQNFYSSTIRPWATQFEQELNAKVLGRNFQAEFDFSEALRADQASRFDAYKTAIEAGWLRRNEVRVIEGYNPVDGIDDAPDEPETDTEPADDEPAEPDPREALRPILRAGVGRLLARQARELGDMHEDKRAGYFARQLDTWLYTLQPIAEAFEAMGSSLDADNIAARFVNLHSAELAAGVDPATWDADDIIGEIFDAH